MGKLKIIVVDDNQTFLEGIIFYLENVLSHEVVGYAYNGKEFLNRWSEIVIADVVLMDIQMPVINGIEVIKRLLWHFQEHKVIAVTGFPETVVLRDYISAGFRGCVFKNRIFEDLSTALDKVVKGRYFFPGNIKIK
ncbi:MAG: response regulator transcription factor [Bacteroidales bacterium]|nr:MAG: response regulator transcription factor [Bacteroidales bacterium]